MLEISHATLTRRDRAGEHRILHDLSLHYPRPHFGAILGPSGCGKSTLLKVIAGLTSPNAGTIRWDGRDLDAEEDIAPTDLGYVPQFSIFHEALTVRESLAYAQRLRTAGRAAVPPGRRLDEVLDVTGLAGIADRRGSQLSGGQRRRLGLALEILTRPALLLCDEVTSGLDPVSEDEIVRLLRSLAHDDQRRLVLSVTHSLGHLSLYDSATVLYNGVVVYSGPPGALNDYFGTDHPEDVYPTLATRTTAEWYERWQNEAAAFGLPPLPPPEEPPQPAEPPEVSSPAPAARQAPPPPPLPGRISQTLTLLARRWRIFFRESNQIGLQLLLLFLFPALVVPFALEGLPQIQNLTLGLDINPLQQAVEGIEFVKQTSRIGGLVSGLIMFQVILMTLQGANNGAREIVSERLIFEKEKLGGVSPTAYLVSKALFLAVLVLAQAVWMTLFVKFICNFPGSLADQASMLILANAALTALTLGVSAWSRSTEQASLVSVYFVGFQVPLSGAFLAMPEALGVLTRPFIAAYWSWSGFLQTLVHTRYYDLAEAITKTPLAPLHVCAFVLVWHVLAGLLLAWLGCRNSRWE